MFEFNFKRHIKKGENISDILFVPFYLAAILSFVLRGVLPFAIYLFLGTIIICILLLAIKFRRFSRIKWPKNGIWFLYLIVNILFVISYIFSFYKPLQIGKDLFNVLAINVIFLMALYLFNTTDRLNSFLKKIATVFVIIQFCIALIGLLKLIFFSIGIKVPYLSQHFSTSIGNDRNMNMMQIVLAAIFVIYDLAKRLNISKRRKLFYSLTLILFFIVIMFSNSRRGILIISFTYLLCFLFLFKKEIRYRFYSFYFLFISVFILLVFGYSLRPDQRRYIIENIFFSDNFIDKVTPVFYRYYVVVSNDIGYVDFSKKIWDVKKEKYSIENCLSRLNIGEFEKASIAAIQLSSNEKTKNSLLWKKYFANVDDTIFQKKYWSVIPFLVNNIEIDFSALIILEGYKNYHVFGYDTTGTTNYYNFKNTENDSIVGVKFRVPSLSQQNYKCSFVTKGENQMDSNFQNLNPSFKINNFDYYVDNEKNTHFEFQLVSNDSCAYNNFFIEFSRIVELEISDIRWVLLPENGLKNSLYSSDEIIQLELFLSGYILSPEMIIKLKGDLVKMNQTVDDSLKNELLLNLRRGLNYQNALYVKFESFATNNLIEDYSGNEEFIIKNEKRPYTSISFPAWKNGTFAVSFKLFFSDSILPYCSRLFISPDYLGNNLLYNELDYLTIKKIDNYYEVKYILHILSNPTSIGQIIIGTKNGKLHQKFMITDFKYKCINFGFEAKDSMSVYQYENLENYLNQQDFYFRRIQHKLLNDSLNLEQLDLRKKYNYLEHKIDNKFLEPRFDRLNLAKCYIKATPNLQKIFGSGFKYIKEFPILLKPKNIDEMLKADSPHNPIVASILYSGFFGGIFMLLFFASIIILVIKQYSKMQLVSISFIIVLFFSFVSGNTFFSIPLFLIVTIFTMISSELS